MLQKTWGLSDFYSSSAEWEYPMGLIQPLNRTAPEILRAMPPGIATQHDEEYLATHSLEFWITSEDLPVAENRVSLDEDGTIRVHYNRNNTRAHERLTHQLASVIARIEGAHFSLADHYRAQVMPIGVNSHQCGTAQFGTHPSTSVLNVNCRTPDVENLYVVDPSFFSSSGAVNPSLTIIANALRVGSHLRDQLAG